MGIRLLQSATLVLVAILSACAPVVAERGMPNGPLSFDSTVFNTTDGRSLRVRSWHPDTPPSTILIAVHGMNEYSGAFEWPAQIWKSQGILTYAYDQRAFGMDADRTTWPGSEALAEDLSAFTQLVAAKHPGLPLYLLGESMGGAVVLLAATRPDLPRVDGLVLVAPAVAPWEALPIHWRAPLWVMAHTVPWLSMTGRGLKLQPTDNIEVWRAMSADPNVIRETRVDAIYGLTQLMDHAAQAVPRVSVQTLLLYGRKDDFVRDWMIDYVVSHALDDRIETRVYEDGYHWLLRDLGASVVLQDLCTWLQGCQPGPVTQSGERLAE